MDMKTPEEIRAFIAETQATDDLTTADLRKALDLISKALTPARPPPKSTLFEHAVGFLIEQAMKRKKGKSTRGGVK